MHAHAGTRIFRVDGRKMVVGYHRPAGPARRRYPTVLFLHGFPGAEKNVDVQRALLARGIASVAPHFLGAWGSAGTYRFTTLVHQARAALRATRRLAFVDPRRVAVYGFSMGGWCALNLAAIEPTLKAAVAVAPVGGPEMVCSDAKFFLARHSQALNVPRLGVLLADFRRAMADYDPARAVARIRAPLLLVHGEDDKTIPPEVSRRLASLAAGPVRLVIQRGAGHDFLGCRDALARLVTRWLAARVNARRSV